MGSITAAEEPGSSRCQKAVKLASAPPTVTRIESGVAPGYRAAMWTPAQASEFSDDFDWAEKF